jgi:hypothetical protein
MTEEHTTMIASAAAPRVIRVLVEFALTIQFCWRAKAGMLPFDVHISPESMTLSGRARYSEGYKKSSAETSKVALAVSR